MRADVFPISVDQKILDDLQQRLARTRLSSLTKSDPLVAGPNDWGTGTNPTYLRTLVAYWRDNYSWGRHEADLNALPHYKAGVELEEIHFVRVVGRGRSPMPLLLLHGWPDSFYRFHKVIPLLSDPVTEFQVSSGDGFDVGDSFDVIVPSLPGFAFTGPIRGDAKEQLVRYTARLMWRLMTEVLGYEHFAIAGGDGGSAIAQCMAIDHPEAVIGIHLTDLGWHATNIDLSTASKAEQKYLEASKAHFMKDGAYVMVQSTRPRSLAPGLNDSPVGLLSWIIDRFHSWADGSIEDRFSRDDLLTNVMLYWVTQTIGSSMYSYLSETRSPSLKPTDHVDVPTAIALFPKDIGGIPPRSLAERTLNVQRWTEMPYGGHFAALEEPELYARDIIQFFRTFKTNTEDLIRPPLLSPQVDLFTDPLRSGPIVAPAVR